MIWSTKSLRLALEGTQFSVPENISVTGKIVINSNSVSKGDLFFSLKGTRSDGHYFAHEAINMGSSAVIVSNPKLLSPDLPMSKVIVVNDGLVALEKLALYKRKNSHALFIGITGSVGKTSTKDAIGTLLGIFGETYSTQGNTNNFLGVLMNLASMPDSTKYCVLELGMNHAGELKTLSELVKPDFAIITNVSACHIENFENTEAIAAAKCEIFDGMKSNGIGIINRTDAHYDFIYENIQKKFNNQLKIYTFAPEETKKEVDAKLSKYESLECEEKVLLDFVVKGEKISAVVDKIPKYFASNFIIPLLIIKILNYDLSSLSSTIGTIKPSFGRGQIITVGNNKFLCDFYNSSPKSVSDSLKYFQSIVHKEKVIIFGDMLELGDQAESFHKEASELCISSGAKTMYFIGKQSKIIYDLISKLQLGIELEHFGSVEEFLKELNDNEKIHKRANKLLKDEKLFIWIKGSRGMKLEKIYEHFLAQAKYKL